VKHIQKQGFNDVITMVTQSDFIRADALGEPVQGAAPQAGKYNELALQKKILKLCKSKHTRKAT